MSGVEFSYQLETRNSFQYQVSCPAFLSNPRPGTRNPRHSIAMARKRYLKKTPLDEARQLILGKVDPAALRSETVAVEQALHRITTEPVFAKISSPHYHAAAMDGICVRAADTFGAT